MMDAIKRLAVCVCTRRRPVMLRNCLNSLIGQASHPGWAVTIVVVENDRTENVGPLIDEVRPMSPCEIVYLLEPRQGIAPARNRCLETALASDVDWIGFLDDDETADPGWLFSMCAAADGAVADVVSGPVIPHYSSDVPDWLPDAKDKSRRTGERLKLAFTNNVVFSRRLVSADGLGLRFDDSFRLSGGEDTDFFTRAVKRGARIIWNAEAVVREHIPPNRLSLRWQLVRAFWVAASSTQRDVRHRSLSNAATRRLWKNLYRIVTGLLLSGFFLCWPLSRSARRLAFTGSKKVASGVGGLAGFSDGRFEPYRTTDGC
jgi:succinoglycan biosynthesis protein ExoM